MESNEELNLVLDYYDKSKHKDKDTIPPEFQIILDKSTTFAYNKKELPNFTSILLAAHSDPSSYEFKKIKLENRLKGDEFYFVNKIIKKMVDIYNNIGKHVENSVKAKS
jgi:hypothetical protein